MAASEVGKLACLSSAFGVNFSHIHLVEAFFSGHGF